MLMACRRSLAVNLFKTAKPKIKELAGYEILQRVGEGGMAEIYQGRHKRNGQIVALKVLRPQFSEDPVVLKRFRQEFDAARKLQHANMVQVLDFGSEGSSHYLVMEYVDGMTLWDLIDKRKRLPEAEAVGVITQVGQALHEAHQLGLIHRDIKPDNILITSDRRVKLADLGLVKDIDNGLDLTRPSQGMGTPNFMAVEQFKDAKHVDVRCDVYSLGATLYMAVSGRLPFDASNIAAILSRKLKNDLAPPGPIAPNVSEQTSRAIRRAVEAEPEKRQRSCLEFIAELPSKSSPAALPVPARRAIPSGSKERSAPRSARSNAKERRASVRYASELGCLCNPIWGDKSFRWSARVRDVSATGVALLLPRRFEPGTILSVELGATAESPSCTLHVRVVRQSRQPGKKWLLGCAFAGPIGDQEAQCLKG
jgi:serine/threonine protein kinase